MDRCAFCAFILTVYPRGVAETEADERVIQAHFAQAHGVKVI